jgi:hypothetical protein
MFPAMLRRHHTLPAESFKTILAPHQKKGYWHGMDGFMLMIGAAVALGSMLGGWLVGDARGRPGAGLLCGFILGPLGVIVAMFLPHGQRTAAGASRRPGQPSQRHHRMPVKGDPIEEWERQQQARQQPAGGRE